MSINIDMRVLAAYCKVCVSMQELNSALSLEPEGGTGSSPEVPGSSTSAIRLERPARAEKRSTRALVPTAR
eukprot:14675960-Heterocapsa_arctica.AAC.1